MKLHRESVEAGFIVGILIADLAFMLVAFTGSPKWMVDILDRMGRM